MHCRRGGCCKDILGLNPMSKLSHFIPRGTRVDSDKKGSFVYGGFHPPTQGRKPVRRAGVESVLHVICCERAFKKEQGGE